MILAALAIGLVGRLDAPTLVASFNSGYGAALGEFALILIPSFVLAACLSHRSAGSAAGAATVASPFMAAGMICPDTSYAALAPVAGRRKLSVALGLATPVSSSCFRRGRSSWRPAWASIALTCSSSA